MPRRRDREVVLRGEELATPKRYYIGYAMRLCVFAAMVGMSVAGNFVTILRNEGPDEPDLCPSQMTLWQLRIEVPKGAAIDPEKQVTKKDVMPSPYFRAKLCLTLQQRYVLPPVTPSPISARREAIDVTNYRNNVVLTYRLLPGDEPLDCTFTTIYRFIAAAQGLHAMSTLWCLILFVCVAVEPLFMRQRTRERVREIIGWQACSVGVPIFLSGTGLFILTVASTRTDPEVGTCEIARFAVSTVTVVMFVVGILVVFFGTGFLALLAFIGLSTLRDRIIEAIQLYREVRQGMREDPAADPDDANEENVQENTGQDQERGLEQPLLHVNEEADRTPRAVAVEEGRGVAEAGAWPFPEDDTAAVRAAASPSDETAGRPLASLGLHTDSEAIRRLTAFADPQHPTDAGATAVGGSTNGSDAVSVTPRRRSLTPPVVVAGAPRLARRAASLASDDSGSEEMAVITDPKTLTPTDTQELQAADVAKTAKADVLASVHAMLDAGSSDDESESRLVPRSPTSRSGSRSSDESDIVAAHQRRVARSAAKADALAAVHALLDDEENDHHDSHHHQQHVVPVASAAPGSAPVGSRSVGQVPTAASVRGDRGIARTSRPQPISSSPQHRTGYSGPAADPREPRGLLRELAARSADPSSPQLLSPRSILKRTPQAQPAGMPAQRGSRWTAVGPRPMPTDDERYDHSPHHQQQWDQQQQRMPTNANGSGFNAWSPPWGNQHGVPGSTVHAAVAEDLQGSTSMAPALGRVGRIKSVTFGEFVDSDNDRSGDASSDSEDSIHALVMEQKYGRLTHTPSVVGMGSDPGPSAITNTSLTATSVAGTSSVVHTQLQESQGHPPGTVHGGVADSDDDPNGTVPAEVISAVAAMVAEQGSPNPGTGPSLNHSDDPSKAKGSRNPYLVTAAEAVGASEAAVIDIDAVLDGATHVHHGHDEGVHAVDLDAILDRE